MSRRDPDRIFLVNLGGSFGFGRKTPGGVVMQNYGPGVHEIAASDAEALDWIRAKTSGRKPNRNLVLVVGPDPPTVESPDPPNRLERVHLTPEGLIDGRLRIVQGAHDVISNLNAELAEDGSVPQSYLCECGARFVHVGPLKRHQRLSCPAREAPDLRAEMLRVAEAERLKQEAREAEREPAIGAESGYDPRTPPGFPLASPLELDP